MLAFQCALRDKLIRHTFDVDSIHSKRGLETSYQHLKMWSDVNGKNDTLSFYVKKEGEPGTHLEFPVKCFEPNPVPHQDNPKVVQICFRRQPKSSEVKRTSWGSTPNIPGSSMMKNLQKRLSFSKTQHSSSEASSPQSLFRRRLSLNREISERGLSPTERSNHRCR